MKDGKRLLYWDACVFIAFFKREEVWGAEVTEGIDQAINGIDQGRCLVVTSSITRSEILMGTLSPEQKSTFTMLFAKRSVILQDVTAKIADRAASIREYYDEQAPRIKIHTPDAIHLATAFIHEADELWTLDGAGGVRTRPSQLLKLAKDERIAGKKLVVKKPGAFPVLPVASKSSANAKTEPDQPLFAGI